MSFAFSSGIIFQPAGLFLELNEDVCSELNYSSSFSFQVQKLLFFVWLVGLVPAAVHVVVMVTRKKKSIIFHSLIHEYMSGKEP